MYGFILIDALDATRVATGSLPRYAVIGWHEGFANKLLRQMVLGIRGAVTPGLRTRVRIRQSLNFSQVATVGLFAAACTNRTCLTRPLHSPSHLDRKACNAATPVSRMLLQAADGRTEI